MLAYIFVEAIGGRRRRNQILGALALIFVIPTLWAISFLQYGFLPADDGRILAEAWRIVQGQVPYRDWISIRTPLSSYLATIWLLFPTHWQFLAARAGYYLFTALASASVYLAFVQRIPDSRGMQIFSACVVTTFWAWSTFHFEPMPWHTSDSCVLATIGIALFYASMKRPSRSLSFAAFFFLGASYLAKQNLAFVPMIAMALRVGEALCTRKIRNLVVSGLGVAAPTIILVFYLWTHQALSDGWEQIRMASDPVALKAADTFRGLSEIFFVSKTDMGWGIAGAGFTIVLMLFGKIRCLETALLSSVFMGTGFLIWIALRQVTIGRGAGFCMAWFLATLYAGWVASLMIRRRIREFIPEIACGLLCLATIWSSAISIGQPYPYFGFLAAPLIVCFVFSEALSGIRQGTDRILVLLGFILCLTSHGFLAKTILQYSPLEGGKRSEKTANLAHLMPKFGSLYVNPETAQEFRDLLVLYRASRVGALTDSETIILPEYPIWHFLNESKNPISADWIQPYEYRDKFPRIIQDLDRLTHRAIVQVASRGNCSRTAREGMVDRWLIGNWKLIAKHGIFCLFENPRFMIGKEFSSAN